MKLWLAFSEWMKEEPRWSQVASLIIFAVGAEFYYRLVLSIFVALTGMALSSENTAQFDSVSGDILILMLIVGIIEEVIFRLIPFLLLTIKRGFFSIDFIMACVVIESAVFGYVHGDWSNVAAQGVSGLIFTLVFLKCGGLQRHYSKALVSSTLTHVLGNYLLLVWLVLL